MSGVTTSSLSLAWSLRNWLILDYEEANGQTVRPWAPFLLLCLAVILASKEKISNGQMLWPNKRLKEKKSRALVRDFYRINPQWKDVVGRRVILFLFLESSAFQPPIHGKYFLCWKPRAVTRICQWLPTSKKIFVWHFYNLWSQHAIMCLDFGIACQ